MNISRKRFVILFIIFALAFQFASNSLFGSEVRLFPAIGQSYLSTDSSIGWKKVGSTILLPVKVVLLGPVVPLVAQLDEDPPPPFIVGMFIIYWAILASVLHYLLRKVVR